MQIRSAYFNQNIPWHRMNESVGRCTQIASQISWLKKLDRTTHYPYMFFGRESTHNLVSRPCNSKHNGKFSAMLSGNKKQKWILWILTLSRHCPNSIHISQRIHLLVSHHGHWLLSVMDWKAESTIIFYRTFFNSKQFLLLRFRWADTHIMVPNTRASLNTNDPW